jgi:hypothetical protein
MASTYTLGDFAAALNGVAESLSDIAQDLSLCDAAAEIDKTPGRTVICQAPPVKSGMCGVDTKDPFTVADLSELVEGLRDWIGDVRDRLGNYDPSSRLDGSWSLNETTD